MMALPLPEGLLEGGPLGDARPPCIEGGPLVDARPPCMVMEVGEAYAVLPVLTLLVLMLPAESLLFEISFLARSSTSS